MSENPESDSQTKFKFSRRRFLQGAALLASKPLVTEMTGIFGQPPPPVPMPEVHIYPTTPKEPELFMLSRPILNPHEWSALDLYRKPFDNAKIGSTTEQEFTTNLDSNVTTTKLENYTSYEIPLPPSSVDELKRTYKDPNRKNEIVFDQDGKVFLKRVVGFIPPNNKQVGYNQYFGLIGRMADESSIGNNAWGAHAQNEFYLKEGLVLVDSPEDLVYEFVVYNPRKNDGSTMTRQEFEEAYTSLFGPEFTYKNPNDPENYGSQGKQK